MSENLEPIKQVIQIDVAEQGTADAKLKVDGLNKSIGDTTKENEKVENSFKSLKVQLREATIEQQKLAQEFGATSDQAIKAAKAVAGIKDEIGLQKDLVESYNPDDKFRALTQTAGVAALALGGVKDGFTALGIESKTLDKVIGSAQAILGVTSAVAGMSDAYAILTASKKAKSASDVVEIGTTEALAVANAEATVTTWSWNAALLANPIVLITAGIVAAGAAIYAFVKITGDAVKAEEKAKVASLQLNSAIDKQAIAFDNNNKSSQTGNDYKIALLRASGASEAQIYKETKALAEQETVQKQLNATKARALVVSAELAFRNTEVGSDAEKEAKKTLERAIEFSDKQTQLLRDSFDKRITIIQDHEIAKVQAQTDARVKSKAAKKTGGTKANKKSKSPEETEQEKEIARLAQEAKDKEMKSARDAVAIVEQLKKNTETPAQKEIREYEAYKDVLDANNLSTEELTRQHVNNLLAIQKTADDKAKTADDKAKADQKASDDKAKEDQKVIDDGILLQKQKNKDDILATGEALIDGAKMLAGKNKALQKAAIIAEGAVSLGKVGVNIATGISKDAASGAVASVPQIIKTVATGVVSTASIISNTARALKALGGGGGVGGESPLPTRNVAQVGFQASSENQIGNAVANQQKNQPPLQAFVVSQSVRDAEELARKKELLNSF